MALLASFFSTRGMAYSTPPQPSLSPKGFREMVSVHSEMTGRGGGHAVLLHYPVTRQSIVSQEPEDATLQGKGRFPLLHGKVPKDVFVIFCLEKRQDHLFEHLNWPQNPTICIYWGILGVVILRRNTEKVGSKPSIPQGNGNFIAPFWHKRSSCCLSTKPGEIGCWVFCIWKHWPKFKEVWCFLPSLSCFYLKMLHSWITGWKLEI